MSAPDSGPLDRDEQLGRLAEEVQLALAAGEELSAERLAERYEVAEAEVVQLITALRLMQESLDEDLGGVAELSAPELPDDYELGQELGRGGMGVVYRAHQKSLDRDVAVKVLRPGDLQFGRAIARFENEARSLARLRHRHIVSVHAVGKASGFVYFTMDLIDGMSLQELIATGKMTNGRAIKLLRQVASAMTYAHGQGVVHRDLKPANILVDKDDDAFVVDFGLARDLGGSDNATVSGQMMGTPSYMSPEQALGDRDKIGEAADIYALGAILYECLTGKRPFEGMPLVQLMHAVVHDEPVGPSKLNARVPTDLEVICQKAMHKRIENRYATVLAFAEDLERFSIGREILARRQSRVSRWLRLARQHKKPLLAVALPAMLLIAAAWMFLLPTVLRNRDLDLGDQMAAQGNDAGAVVAYRSAMGVSNPSDLELSVRVRLARSLTNQAGTLLLRGAQQEQVDSLISEASSLIGDEHRTRHGTTNFDEDNASYEWLRIEALRGKFAQLINNSQMDVFARARRDLAGSGRDATLCLFAMWITTGAGSTLSEFGEAGCDAILELITKWQFLKDPVGDRFRDIVLSGSANNFFEQPNARYLEKRLIELIRDESQPMHSRKAAAALCNASGTMPFGRRFNVKKLPNWATNILIVDDSDLPRLVAAWDEAQELPRAEAFRRRIAFVGESLCRPLPKLGRKYLRLDYKLEQWLHLRTGTSINRERWIDWWQKNRTRAPQEWLLEALQWDIDPSELTPETAVARFADIRPPSSYQHATLHHLLTLLAPDGIEFPRQVGSRSTRQHWERLLGTRPDTRHPVRIAALGFVNGDPKPQILWQTRQVLGVDEQFAWTEAIEPEARLRTAHIGMPRQPWMNDATDEIILRGKFKLGWRQDVAEGNTESRFQRLTPTYQMNGQYPSRAESAVGIVTATDGWVHYPRSGQSYIDVITLTLIEPEGTPEADWGVSEWLHAADNTLHLSDNLQSAAPGAATMASFLPLPSQELALRNVFQQLQGSWGAKFSNYARCGLLLAGDATAIDLPEYEPQKRLDRLLPMVTPPSFWVRLALSATKPVISDYAFEQLRKQKLLPAFKRTLQAALQDGTEMPEWLAKQVRSEPSATASYLGSAVGMFGWLLVTIMAIMASAMGARRARDRTYMRLWALALWVASLILANFSIWLNGTQWNSPWLGHSINVIATWMLCWRLFPHWSWLIGPTLWTVITGAHLLGQFKPSEVMTYYGIGLSYFLVIRVQLLVFQFRVKRLEIRKRAAAR